MASSPKKTATRIRVKIGDVFAVEMENKRKKHFQYVADDSTQLNSYVIRTFTHTYGAEQEIILNEIVEDEIGFFALVFLRIGLRLGYWVKIGNVPYEGKVDVYFRGSSDSGNPKIKRSEGWYVSKINEPFVDVGKLEGKYQTAEVGVVVSPDSIVHRMRTGQYDFVYPDY